MFRSHSHPPTDMTMPKPPPSVRAENTRESCTSLSPDVWTPSFGTSVATVAETTSCDPAANAKAPRTWYTSDTLFSIFLVLTWIEKKPFHLFCDAMLHSERSHSGQFPLRPISTWANLLWPIYFGQFCQFYQGQVYWGQIFAFQISVIFWGCVVCGCGGVVVVVRPTWRRQSTMLVRDTSDTKFSIFLKCVLLSLRTFAAFPNPWDWKVSCFVCERLSTVVVVSGSSARPCAMFCWLLNWASRCSILTHQGIHLLLQSSHCFFHCDRVGLHTKAKGLGSRDLQW